MGPVTSRTVAAEVEALIGTGEIAVAVDGERIVGCVRVQLLTGGAGEFGMLAVDPSQRREGLGGALVGFAEQWCCDNGRDPCSWSCSCHGSTHPVKAFRPAVRPDSATRSFGWPSSRSRIRSLPSARHPL